MPCIAHGEVPEINHLGLVLLNVRNRPTHPPPCCCTELNKLKGESPFPRGGRGYKMNLAPASGLRFLDDVKCF
jgi:hypothetical protein